MSDDMRYYETFYGIYPDDWSVTFGSFANEHHMLVKNYISDGCSTTENSIATDGEVHKFIYEHHIKKKYFIEGVIIGHITLAAHGDDSVVTSYRVTVCKVHDDNTETELFTTGWVTVADTLTWDGANSVGEEMVYPFWIDAWQYETLTDQERIYVKVQVDGNAFTRLMHSNSSTWEDLKIEIPFRL